MNFNKKLFFFATLALVATNNSTNAMLGPVKKGIRRAGQITAQGITQIGNVLLGRESTGQIEPFNFVELPEELQKYIFDMLFRGEFANNINEAVYTITSLSLVNKQLNELITNTEFAIALCKHLAKKFKNHPATVAEKLHNKEAEEYFSGEVLPWGL